MTKHLLSQRWLLVILLSGYFSIAAMAQTTWTGTNGTSWTDPGNWSAGVPDATDDVTIPNTANKPTIGALTAAVAKSVKITVALAQLTISSTASLSINGSTGFALENFGTLDNSGTIRIGNTSSVADRGIVHRNGGTLNNKTGGLIQIDRTSAVEAFFTSGVVNNEATIEIGSNAAVTGTGVSIVAGTGVFNNKTGGLLTINRSTGFALENKGTLDNSGTIRIGNIAAVGNIGIVHRNGGTLNNKMGGVIELDRTGGAQAFYSTGLVNNEATIKIGSNAAISGEGVRIEGNVFNNKPGGTIQIDQTSSTGIRLRSGTVNNEALIEIGSQSNVKGFGISTGSGSTFNNKTGGDIRINRIGILDAGGIGVILNEGTFTNNALITTGNIGHVYAQDGILNGGSFTNSATGVISIAKPWGNGIWSYSGTFQNAGKITIKNVVGPEGDFSTGILSYAPFTNHSGAEIHLDLVGGGIISTNAFTNAGIIRMGENGPLAGSGIYNLQANAVFNNNTGGDISIKQTAVDGVLNDALSTFNNNACAKLTVLDNVNNAGTFTNGGLFTVNTAQAHANTGTLTNNGIIDYPTGNPIPNVTNNGIIVTPIGTSVTTITPALQIGGANTLTIGTTWYTDPALTQPAGSFNPATNTFVPSQLPLTSPLYFSINDPINGCARTLPINLIIASAAPVCIAGNPLNLSTNISASNGYRYAWKGPNGFKSSSATPSKAKTVAKDEGIYSVTVTNSLGYTLTSTVRVYFGVGNITATSNSPVCKGGTIQLSATSEFGVSYSWTKQLGSTVYTGPTPTIPNAKTSDGGLYVVFITRNDGCIDKQEVLVTVSPVPCVGSRIASEEAEEIDMQINAYPNPVTNTLTVEITMKEPSKLRLQLFNSIGKESGTWQLNEEATVHKTELNMSALTGGVYLLQAQAGKQKVVKRVVKVQY